MPADPAKQNEHLRRSRTPEQDDEERRPARHENGPEQPEPGSGVALFIFVIGEIDRRSRADDVVRHPMIRATRRLAVAALA
jgi:hypothetical protein